MNWRKEKISGHFLGKLYTILWFSIMFSWFTTNTNINCPLQLYTLCMCACVTKCIHLFPYSNQLDNWANKRLHYFFPFFFCASVSFFWKELKWNQKFLFCEKTSKLSFRSKIYGGAIASKGHYFYTNNTNTQKKSSYYVQTHKNTKFSFLFEFYTLISIHRNK